MDPIWLERVILVVVGVIAGALLVGALWVARIAGWRHLRRRFGPEHERTGAQRESRTEADRELLEREQRASQLRMRHLTARDRRAYGERWDEVQGRFVDEPERALSAAHALLEELMGELGYPTGSFEEEVELVSVHHPAAVEHFRAAYAVARAQREGGAASTEDQRQALIHYRLLFAELLGVRSRAPEPREPVIH